MSWCWHIVGMDKQAIKESLNNKAAKDNNPVESFVFLAIGETVDHLTPSENSEIVIETSGHTDVWGGNGEFKVKLALKA